MIDLVSVNDPEHLLSGIVSEHEMQDLVSAFYRYDQHVRISIGRKPSDPRDRKKKTMGLHFWTGTHHSIDIFVDNIRDSFKGGTRAGGNYPPPSFKMAVGMVLVHELTHANQAHTHSRDERFYNARVYKSRPCEREARATVDGNMRIISEILSEPFVQSNVLIERPPEDQEILDIVDSFSLLDEVKLDDIKDELRSSRILTPSNVLKISDMLRSLEVQIVRK